MIYGTSQRLSPLFCVLTEKVMELYLYNLNNTAHLWTVLHFKFLPIVSVAPTPSLLIFFNNTIMSLKLKQQV